MDEKWVLRSRFVVKGDHVDGLWQIGRQLGLVLLLCLLGTHAQAEDEPFPQPYPWDTSWCEPEEECPSRYNIKGFDVWIAHQVYDAPNFTHAALGRELDILKAQMVWITSHNSVPQSAIRQLIESEISFYLDVGPDWSPWWPCSREGGRTAACYNPGVHRIGIPVLGTMWPHPNKFGKPNLVNNHTEASLALHELAPAFHFRVVAGGAQNVCLQRQYERSKHLYEAVEQREQLSQNLQDGRPLDHPGRDPETRPVVLRHYATTNVFEYFAEGSEALFGFNDFYPWNRNGLWEHDWEGYRMIWNAWHHPKTFCPEQEKEQD